MAFVNLATDQQLICIALSSFGRERVGFLVTGCVTVCFHCALMCPLAVGLMSVHPAVRRVLVKDVIEEETQTVLLLRAPRTE